MTKILVIFVIFAIFANLRKKWLFLTPWKHNCVFVSKMSRVGEFTKIVSKMSRVGEFTKISRPDTFLRWGVLWFGVAALVHDKKRMTSRDAPSTIPMRNRFFIISLFSTAKPAPAFLRDKCNLPLELYLKIAHKLLF